MPNVMCIYMGQPKAPGACEIYRCNLPLFNLSELDNWGAGWAYAADIDANMKRYGSRYLAEIVNMHDIFVFPRAVVLNSNMRKELGKLYTALRNAGKRIVYEVDDDFTKQDRRVTDGDAMWPAKMADAITVTTPILGELMKERTGRPYYVLPNSLDRLLWEHSDIRERPEPVQGKVSIALTGSSTHARDWLVLKDVLPEISRRDDVHIILMGFHPEYLEGMDNTTYMPAMGYESYSQIIRHSDIVLAPVNDEKFNLGKSPIKATEGQGAVRILPDNSKAGAAVIASDNEVYRLGITNNEDGLLVDYTPEAWRDAIIHLIENTSERHRLQKRAYETVYERFDSAKNAVLWADAYSEILANPPNPKPIKIK